jgi:predicted GNAT family acetyltransferase
VTVGPQTHSDGSSGQEPAVTVADNPPASRFELRVDNELAAYATYRDVRDGRAFDHTIVAAGFERLGLASELIRYSLDESRRGNLPVLPFCPFVRLFIRRHPAYVDLVDQPERFGLSP